MLKRRDDPELRQRAGEAANRIEADDDFITAWLVAGPFSREGAGPTELFDLEFAPEREPEAHAVAWPRLAVTNPQTPGIFDLGKAVGGGNRCVYVKTHLWSDREREVLCLVAAGLPNKLIARRLEISEKTVKAHLTSVFQQIGVTDRTQAALWASRNGLGPD